MKKKAMPAAKARTGSPRLNKATPKKGAGKAPGRGDGVSRRGKKKKVLSAQCSVSKKRAGVPAVPSKKVKPVKVAGPEVAMEDGQQERFCRMMALGAYSNYSCYAQAYPDGTVESARANSSRLLTNDNIRARIDWIREDSLKEVKIRIEEQLSWYLTVKDTPTGYVDAESPLCQEVNYDPETGAVSKIKIPSKMDAAKQIDKLMGFEKKDDDPRDKAIDAMAEMVRMIREGRRA